MKKEKFLGAIEKRTSVLGNLEKKFVDKYTPYVPKFLETYHLTLLTIPFSLLIILFGYFAQFDLIWLWGISLMIVLQYITDLFDGAVGRYRNTGLVRWGYYMDHFLDYIFLCSILIAYAFILPDNLKYILFFILAIFGAFMVNSYLIYGAINRFPADFFRISPTEIRLIMIIFNAVWFFVGNSYLFYSAWIIFILSLLSLIFVVYKTHKEIWAFDMKKH